MIKKCIICGGEFKSPPSAKKVTCGKDCQRIHARNRAIAGNATARIHSDQARRNNAESLRNSPEAYKRAKKASDAALKNPKNKKGRENRIAREWVLESPEGKIYIVVNLLDWARENYTLFEPKAINEKAAEAAARRVSAGIRIISRSMRGTIAKGQRPATTYKGWRLLEPSKEIPR